MRKIFITVIALFASLLTDQVQAQVEKGKFLIGTRSDFNAFSETTKDEVTTDGTNTTESDGPKTVKFGLTPTVGYFFMDGFAGGLFMNLGIENSKVDEVLEDGSTETLKDNNTLFKIGPFIRYYLDMEKVKPFAHLQVGFGSKNNTYDEVGYDFTDPLNPLIVITENKKKYGLSTWGIGAGAAFFITGNIAVDVMLGYNSNTTKYKDDASNYESRSNTGGFGVDVGFSIIIP